MGSMATAAQFLPCCPVALRGNVLTLAIPADAAPWLGPLLIPLADPVSGLSSTDGHTVAVCIFRVDHSAGVVLMTAQAVSWAADGRWPSADQLAAFAARCPSHITYREVSEHPDFSGAVLPGPISVTPMELDSAVAGALAAGPWAGVCRIQWPPPEPEPGATSDGPAHSGYRTPPGELARAMAVSLGVANPISDSGAAHSWEDPHQRRPPRPLTHPPASAVLAVGADTSDGGMDGAWIPQTQPFQAPPGLLLPEARPRTRIPVQQHPAGAAAAPGSAGATTAPTRRPTVAALQREVEGMQATNLQLQRQMDTMREELTNARAGRSATAGAPPRGGVVAVPEVPVGDQLAALLAPLQEEAGAPPHRRQRMPAPPDGSRAGNLSPTPKRQAGWWHQIGPQGHSPLPPPQDLPPGFQRTPAVPPQTPRQQPPARFVSAVDVGSAALENLARENYARHFGVSPGEISVSEVQRSPGGVVGWANAGPSGAYQPGPGGAAPAPPAAADAAFAAQLAAANALAARTAGGILDEALMLPEDPSAQTRVDQS